MECTSRGLFGRCRKWERQIEYFDLTDTAVRDQLINMGFVLRVREKVAP